MFSILCSWATKKASTADLITKQKCSTRHTEVNEMNCAWAQVETQWQEQSQPTSSISNKKKTWSVPTLVRSTIKSVQNCVNRLKPNYYKHLLISSDILVVDLVPRTGHFMESSVIRSKTTPTKQQPTHQKEGIKYGVDTLRIFRPQVFLKVC